MMELFGDDDGGDDELRTSVYPPNLAPIGAKLRQNLQLSIFRRRKNVFGKLFGSKSQCFVNLVRFWRTSGRMDVKISFLVKFCSR